jgi:hypothetical protein
LQYPELVDQILLASPGLYKDLQELRDFTIQHDILSKSTTKVRKEYLPGKELGPKSYPFHSKTPTSQMVISVHSNLNICSWKR